jgi:hypothetical protein
MRRILKIFAFLLATLFAGNMSSQMEDIRHTLSFDAFSLSNKCFLISDKGKPFSKTNRIQFNSQRFIFTPNESNLEVTKSLILKVDYKNLKVRNTSELMVADVVFSPSISHSSLCSTFGRGEKEPLFTNKATSNENEISKIRLYENRDEEIVDKKYPSDCPFDISSQIFNGIVMIRNVDTRPYIKKKTNKVG